MSEVIPLKISFEQSPNVLKGSDAMDNAQMPLQRTPTGIYASGGCWRQEALRHVKVGFFQQQSAAMQDARVGHDGASQ